MPDPQRVLVTGALGCLGAWTIRALLDQGKEPVGFDLGDDTSRLELVLGAAEVSRVELVRGDITDLDALERVLAEHSITHVVHLAALQVPASRADPTLGARVNVLGTVNVFEAVRRSSSRVAGVAYASSAAVYSQHDPSPGPESGGTSPQTLYGVWKLANEGTARVHWTDAQVASIGIRPYVVYGPGRDQGLTSGPSLALAAAARGDAYEIGYVGAAQYDYAPDVGRAFALAAGAATDGAHVANFPGVQATVEEVVAAIEAAAPEVAGRITCAGEPLPFPSELEAVLLECLVGPLPRTRFEDGARLTIGHFRTQQTQQN